MASRLAPVRFRCRTDGLIEIRSRWSNKTFGPFSKEHIDLAEELTFSSEPVDYPYFYAPDGTPGAILLTSRAVDQELVLIEMERELSLMREESIQLGTCFEKTFKAVA